MYYQLNRNEPTEPKENLTSCSAVMIKQQQTSIGETKTLNLIDQKKLTDNHIQIFLRSVQSATVFTMDSHLLLHYVNKCIKVTFSAGISTVLAPLFDAGHWSLIIGKRFRPTSPLCFFHYDSSFPYHHNWNDKLSKVFSSSISVFPTCTQDGNFECGYNVCIMASRIINCLSTEDIKCLFATVITSKQRSFFTDNLALLVKVHNAEQLKLSSCSRETSNDSGLY